MPYKKKAVAKKPAYKKKAYVPRAPKFDGTNLLLSNYFEVKLAQTGVQPGIMAYSLICDIDNMLLTLAKTGDGAISAGNGVDAIATGSKLAFPQYNNHVALFNMYKTNFVRISVTTDRGCGLDNPVIFLTDSNDGTPVTVVSKAMAQPHKQYTMTESRRTAKYGWTAKSIQEKEYAIVGQPKSSSAGIHLRAIKVMQDIEGKADETCTHRVTIQVGVTLRDGKNA